MTRGIQGYTMDDVAGIILVGGASKRYGKPKALEEIDGKTFLERIYKELSELTSAIFISYSGKTPEKVIELAINLGGKLIKDNNLPCTGPPRGLSSIASSSMNRSNYYWITAVDYPYIKADTLGKMAETAEKTGVEALTPLLPGGYIAVTLGYVKYSALQKLRESCSIRKHLTRTTDIYRGAKTSLYPDWSYFSTEFTEFLNVNTPNQQKQHVPIPSRQTSILSNGDLFSKSLFYIEKGKYREAGILYLSESEQYYSLGLTLLSIHARKDAQRIMGLE